MPYKPTRISDRYVCIGSSGGGYGPPFERAPEAVLDDVRDGYISRETAARDYGVVLTDEIEIDQAATAAMRKAT